MKLLKQALPNKYDVIFSISVEVPGYVFSMLTINTWGRRPVLSLCMVCHHHYHHVIIIIIIIIDHGIIIII